MSRSTRTKSPKGTPFKGRKVLLAGGLGFIGSNLARRLVKMGAEVVILDNLMPNSGANLFNISGIERKVKVNISDVQGVQSMRFLVQEQDYLFNLAGQTSHLDSMHDPYTDLEINCRSQLSILEACRHHNPRIKVIFASTRQIYGKPEFLPVKEDHLLRPVDVNGINKMAGEGYHILYNNVYGVAACALRLTNTYGPRMRVKDARQTFLGYWIRCLVEGRPFEVWGGRQLRDFTFVDDAVDALILAAVEDATNGKVFNLGGDCPVSLNDLAALLVEINGAGKFAVRSFPREQKRIDIGDYYADYGRIQSVLGWHPTIKLRTGLAKTLDYYRRHLKHYL
jgi:UDP-glucose 4-epimerase